MDRWTRPKRFDRNLIVIGGGSAGLVTAYVAAAAQAKVTLVEAGEMGGDCLNTGCVPSKALIRAAKVAAEMRGAARFGIAPAEPQVDFRAVMARVRAVIAEIAPHDSVERYEGLGVEVIRGRARLVDPWTVDVDGRRLTARAIVLATGAEPVRPDLAGVEVLTSETLWDALAARETPPERMVILGGGPIGCELAQALRRLGAGVTLVEAGPRLLPREDAEVSDLALRVLEAEGVTVRLGVTAGAVGGALVLSDGTRLEADLVLAAIGRRARVKGFGLEELGIRADRVIETDGYLRTRFPHILVAGDAAGPFQLTHAGAHQGWFAAMNGLFGDVWKTKADYRVLPAVTYMDPEIARVGLTEAEARAQGLGFEVTRYGLDDLDRAIADGAVRGFVKVISGKGGRILGVTVAGAHAGELIAEWALAMKAGLRLGQVLGTVHAYPTMAESAKYAAGIWRRAHLDPRLLALLRRFQDWRRG